jgi:DNA-directed RNA polymerase specialized sigma24 family protein
VDPSCPSHDPDADRTFDQWVHEYAPLVRRIVVRRVPPDAVDDVCQEVWLAAWRTYLTAEAIESPAALLTTIALRRAADWVRGAVTTVPAGSSCVAAPAPHPEDVSLLLQQVGVAPGSLLWHRIVDGWTLPQLAAAFEIPLGTVKSRIHHQSRQLRARLHDVRHPDAHGLPLDLCSRSGCPACRQTLEAIGRRTRPHDWFQALAIAVDSTLGLRMDGRCSWTLPLSGPLTVVSQPLHWPRPTLRDLHGRNLAGRIRTVGGPFPQLGYTLLPTDPQGLHLRASFTPTTADALGLVAGSRSGFSVTIPIACAAELDDTLFIQLPRNARLADARPAPAWRGAVHGAPAVLWRHTNALRSAPTVAARWVI